MGNISTTTIQQLNQRIDTLLPTGSNPNPPPYITSLDHALLQRAIVDRITARIVDVGVVYVRTRAFQHVTGVIQIRYGNIIPDSNYMVVISPYETIRCVQISVCNKTPTSFTWQAYQYRTFNNQSNGATNFTSQYGYAVICTNPVINDTINENKQ